MKAYPIWFNPAYAFKPEIQQLRNDLRGQERQLLHALGSSASPPLFQSPEPMSRLLQAGRQAVVQRLLAPSGPQEMPKTDEMDSALALVAHSDLRLGETLQSDVQNHLQVLDKLKDGLVRNNGMVRYLPYTASSSEMDKDLQPHRVSLFDDYLEPNINVAAMPNGQITLGNKVEIAKSNLLAKNPSLRERPEELGLLSTRELGIVGQEAQWFLVSDLSTGYGRQVEKLLDLSRKKIAGRLLKSCFNHAKLG
jgi:hypothetical protein